MAIVHTRVFLAAGAWLLGVVAATGGSLAAVSLIGQSIAAPPTQQLTVSAVSHALASGRRDPDPSVAARPSPAPSHRHAGATPEASASATSSAGTLLSSSGGSVLAGCAGPDAYLISWSPQQGYAADYVVRGPAAKARVVFLAGSGGVNLTVTCTGSVPSEVVSPVQSQDDGGGQPGDN
jgi:hypothetical protein